MQTKSVCEALSFYPTEEISDYAALVDRYPLHHKFFVKYVKSENNFNVFGWTK
jgi:hypothetical protein